VSNQEIATMASVQEKVKERIQASFMDLIPPELWEGMVQQHLNKFQFEELPKLVKAEAEKRLREVVADEFKKPEWSEQWFNGSPRVSALLAATLKEAAPDLVTALFSRLAVDMVAIFRNQNSRGY
jgi:hypothetical protein